MLDRFCCPAVVCVCVQENCDGGIVGDEGGDPEVEYFQCRLGQETRLSLPLASSEVVVVVVRVLKAVWRYSVCW